MNSSQLVGDHNKSVADSLVALFSLRHTSPWVTSVLNEREEHIVKSYLSEHIKQVTLLVQSDNKGFITLPLLYRTYKVDYI